jgi:hypothetical protein
VYDSEGLEETLKVTLQTWAPQISAAINGKLIFGMQPYFDPTRKMTSKNMEDDLKKNEINVRRPQIFLKKWKKT